MSSIQAQTNLSKQRLLTKSTTMSRSFVCCYSESESVRQLSLNGLECHSDECSCAAFRCSNWSTRMPYLHSPLSITAIFFNRHLSSSIRLVDFYFVTSFFSHLISFVRFLLAIINFSSRLSTFCIFTRRSLYFCLSSVCGDDNAEEHEDANRYCMRSSSQQDWK